MKKIMIAILFFIVTLTTQNAFAYVDFQEYETVGHGKLIKQFSDEDYKDYYSKINGFQLFGWKHYIANEDIKMKFISETMFCYYNNGKSNIEYKYESNKTLVKNYDLRVNGSLKLGADKKEKTFGLGLDFELNIDYKSSLKREEKENLKINVDIKPQDQLIAYMYGEGRITNGVAKKYLFGLEIHRGAFEIFRVTTHYHRLEVTPI